MAVFSSKKDTKPTAHNGVLSRDHTVHLETEQNTSKQSMGQRITHRKHKEIFQTEMTGKQTKKTAL